MDLLGSRADFTISQFLFIKTLAFSYLVAYASLLWQVTGLWGEKGILPIKNSLHNLKSALGKSAYWKTPSLFWFRSDDQTLRIVAATGALLSAVLLFGGPPLLILPLLWFGYLSFITVGDDFLSFQWDILILELTVFGFFFALQTPPSFPILFVGWFILFRFMFSSGVVKIRSQCPAWRSLTAMGVHYETQPLPTRSAWFMHQLPLWMAKGQTIGTFILELVFPFFFFLPDPIRYVMALIQIGLQLLIIATGNYAFFNILTIGLCFLLIENSHYPDWMQEWQFSAGVADPEGLMGPILTGVLSVSVFMLLALNVLQLFSLFGFLGKQLDPIRRMARYWYLCNPYGLFARMTTERNEIVIEGSDDGKMWKEYVFYWKPQDVKQAPKRVMPHQPRLDWQMWFAALGGYKQFKWFQPFMQRLLEGSPGVLKLLKVNPFPEKPPKYVRAQFYKYHFSDWKTGKKTGQWWVREHQGLYCPIFSLKEEQPPSQPQPSTFSQSGVTQMSSYRT